METPSETIRRIITERNMSHSEVARLCGVPVSTISRFMRDERGLSSETFDRLFLGLGLVAVPKELVSLTEVQQEAIQAAISILFKPAPERPKKKPPRNP